MKPLLVDNICQRCNKQSKVVTMSYFNTDIICMDCDKLERAHPKFKTAQDIELKAVQAGNLNFPGIGKPVDL